MKPKPWVELNHLTVPVAISIVLRVCLVCGRAAALPTGIEILEIDVSKREERVARIDRPKYQ
jgi:hypothetical protein